MGYWSRLPCSSDHSFRTEPLICPSLRATNLYSSTPVKRVRWTKKVEADINQLILSSRLNEISQQLTSARNLPEALQSFIDLSLLHTSFNSSLQLTASYLEAKQLHGLTMNVKDWNLSKVSNISHCYFKLKIQLKNVIAHKKNQISLRNWDLSINASFCQRQQTILFPCCLCL